MKANKFLNVWNIASLIVLVISFITFGVSMYGMIDTFYTVIIMMSLMVIQTVIVLVRILSIRNKIKRGDYSWIERGVVIPKSTFSDKYVKVEDYILSKGVTPTNALPLRKCIYRLCVELDGFPEEPIMMLDRTYDSKTNTVQLNKGKRLAMNCLYVFDVVSISGEILNFKFSQGGLLKKFSLEELYLL